LLRRQSPDGGVVTLVGQVSPVDDGYVNGPLSSAKLARPHDVKLSPVDGKLYVADEYNAAIRKVDLAAGQVSTFAGGSTRQPGTTNGSLGSARFDTPTALAFGKDGTGAPALYVSDNGNAVVRKIDLNAQQVSTFAGTMGSTGSTDGPV